jgi:ABC-type multidrug transport system fused ATPase/permease subunit
LVSTGTTKHPHLRIFARLLGFLRPYRWSLAVSIVLAAASQAASIALIRLTQSVIDDAIRPRDHRMLWILVGIIAGLGAVKALLMVGRRFISGRQALGVEFDMRNALYAHLLRLSFGFYDRHQTGQLMSRATVDLQGVRFFLGYGLIFFAQNLFTIIGVTAIMFWTDWRLALVTLAITPILITLAFRYSHVSHPVLRDVQQKMADVATVAEEKIVGVHVVK